MTPERIKYIKSMSKREKVLKCKIDEYRGLIGYLKSVVWGQKYIMEDSSRESYYDNLKSAKILLCAVKHELERGGKTKVKLKKSEPYGDLLDVYECNSCKSTFADTDGNYKYCPYCGKRIKMEAQHDN